MKSAIVTGVTGQDGAYLSEWLIKQQYRVIGVTRNKATMDVSKLRYLNIDDKIIFEACDLTDANAVRSLVDKHMPDEIYNLAAQSSVALSFEQPYATLTHNIFSVLNVLESIRLLNKNIRLCQASSSEMFGRVSALPITTESPIQPQSPYGTSKATGFWAVKNYRTAHEVFACNGILFTHESYLRPDTFFVKKIIKKSVEIAKGKLDELRVGNIDLKRDFGFAPEYVKALWLSLQQPAPGDYIISSGRSTSLREIVHHVFDRLNIPRDRIISDKSLFRPVDIDNIYGDNRNTKEKLNWNYNMDFFQVLDKLVDEELFNYRGT